MKKLLLILFVIGVTVSAQPVITPSTPPVVKQGTTFGFTANETVTWTLVSGSLGSINSSTGVYTAPSSIPPQNVVGGCEDHANSHVYNTRIDALPVHASSTTWINAVNGVVGNTTMAIGPDFPINQVLSTAPDTEAMHFFYTSANDTIYTVPPKKDWIFENGYYTWTFGPDRHSIIVLTDTCHIQEMYNHYPAGFN